MTNEAIIPIILNSDPEDIIGWCHVVGDCIDIRFNEDVDVTRAEFFDMLSCAAYFKEIEAAKGKEISFDDYIVRSARVHSFNLTRLP